MKNILLKVIAVVLVMLVFSIAAPRASEAHGWYGAGWVAAGLFTGLAIGALSGPRYYAPAPVYVTPPPPVVYSYPAPTGRWIQVPGQWVNGQLIPPHNAWVPTP